MIWRELTQLVPKALAKLQSNSKTGWQSDIQTNIGLDAILWNNKLTFSADWYKKSTGLRPIGFNLSLAQSGCPFVNVGDLKIQV
jgi:hypothetical protein